MLGSVFYFRYTDSEQQRQEKDENQKSISLDVEFKRNLNMWNIYLGLISQVKSVLAVTKHFGSIQKCNLCDVKPSQISYFFNILQNRTLQQKILIV